MKLLDAKAGATRRVLMIGKYVIKLPRMITWEHFLSGLLANLSERQYGGKFHWCGRLPGICPVLFGDPLGLIVIMPRCSPMNRKLTDEEFTAFVDRPNYIIPAENKPDSFGILNGEMVAVDFG